MESLIITLQLTNMEVENGSLDYYSPLQTGSCPLYFHVMCSSKGKSFVNLSRLAHLGTSRSY